MKTHLDNVAESLDEVALQVLEVLETDGETDCATEMISQSLEETLEEDRQQRMEAEDVLSRGSAFGSDRLRCSMSDSTPPRDVAGYVADMAISVRSGRSSR